MNSLPSSVSAIASLTSTGTLPAIPELQDVAYLDQDCDTIRVRLNEMQIDQVIDVLSARSFALKSHSLTVNYDDEFWSDPPDDCAGGYLWADGCVSVNDSRSRKEIIPLEETLYIHGRPESDTGETGGKPHVLNSVGGIPIVSERLLVTLNKLGAEGKAADIIYRGHNRAAYDTIQKGYKRFLVTPEYEVTYNAEIDFLPRNVPNDFGFCSLMRCRWECSWYDLAMPLSVATELLKRRRTVLLQPLFWYDGPLHTWLKSYEKAIAALKF